MSTQEEKTYSFVFVSGLWKFHPGREKREVTQGDSVAWCMEVTIFEIDADLLFSSQELNVSIEGIWGFFSKVSHLSLWNPTELMKSEKNMTLHLQEIDLPLNKTQSLRIFPWFLIMWKKWAQVEMTTISPMSFTY